MSKKNINSTNLLNYINQAKERQSEIHILNKYLSLVIKLQKGCTYML